MPGLLIVARESKALTELVAGLQRTDFAFSVTASQDQAARSIADHAPDCLLVETRGHPADVATWEFIRKAKQQRALPVIALLSDRNIEDLNGYLPNVEDFIISPYSAAELLVRLRRLLNKSRTGADIIKCDGLVIDLTNCDVTLRGKVVELTFKEYELLKLLAANKGRVYTREELLDKIWGYEYYGGDRTVDVHIRRLRSKIEGPGEVYIETVRNIGYRFKKDPQR